MQSSELSEVSFLGITPDSKLWRVFAKTGVAELLPEYIYNWSSIFTEYLGGDEDNLYVVFARSKSPNSEDIYSVARFNIKSKEWFTEIEDLSGFLIENEIINSPIRYDFFGLTYYQEQGQSKLIFKNMNINGYVSITLNETLDFEILNLIHPDDEDDIVVSISKNWILTETALYHVTNHETPAYLFDYRVIPVAISADEKRIIMIQMNEYPSHIEVLSTTTWERSLIRKPAVYTVDRSNKTGSFLYADRAPGFGEPGYVMRSNGDIILINSTTPATYTGHDYYDFITICKSVYLDPPVGGKPVVLDIAENKQIPITSTEGDVSGIFILGSWPVKPKTPKPAYFWTNLKRTVETRLRERR